MRRARRGSVARNLLIALGIVAVTFAVLVAAQLFMGILGPRQPKSSVPATTEKLRGMLVNTIDDVDFPSSPDLSTAELKAELDEITSFAAAFGYNAIFFEAVPDCTAFYRSSAIPESSVVTGGFSGLDPLDYLTDSAKKQGLSVYAVINPLRLPSGSTGDDFPAKDHSEWVLCERLKPDIEGVQKLVGKITAELTRGYDISGVLLKGLDDGVPVVPEAVEKLVSTASGAVKHKDSQRFGVLLNSPDALAELSGGLDMVVANVSASLGDITKDDSRNAADDAGDVTDESTGDITGENGGDVTSAANLPFDEWLDSWKSAAETSGATFYSLHQTSDAEAATHAIDDALFVEAKADVSGTIIGRYGTLNTERRAAAISLAASFTQPPSSEFPDGWDTELRTFAVTRPAEEITVDPSWETYFITGTSDPALPVTCDGESLAQSPDMGLWGTQVEVAYGVNTYSFAQGDVTYEVVIRRNKPSDSPAQISDIVASSAFPASSEAVLDGQKLKLSCKAPSGGSVTATLGGQKFELEQVAETSEDGIPALYQASEDISALAVSGEVKNLGAIEYTLSYDGKTSSATSAGSVYAAGEGASPIASMSTFIVPVNKNAADDGIYDTILKQGCVDTIIENLGGYYRLSSGGYLLKGTVDILEGETEALIQNTVTTAKLAPTAKGETIILGGTTRPAFRGALSDDALSITLFSTEFSGVELDSLKGELCESASYKENGDGSVTVSVDIADGARLLGWDVRFDENNTVINLHRTPEIHLDTAKPLSDVTVVLDPGHGGDDPGAMGIPALSGPTESALNLAASRAAQSRLEALGATVFLAHNDENSTLNDRMEFSEKHDADFFISNHHNSLGLTSDANTAAGIEVYYYNDQSAAFAESIGENLAVSTGRKLRFVNQSWYRVTMMTDCPSVLVESGFLCNPKEYEAIASDRSLLKYGSSVADAVMEYLSGDSVSAT